MLLPNWDTFLTVFSQSDLMGTFRLAMILMKNDIITHLFFQFVGQWKVLGYTLATIVPFLTVFLLNYPKKMADSDLKQK